MFKDLRDASLIFLFYEILSIVFTLVTIVLIIGRVLGKMDGCCGFFNDWSGYIFPTIGLLCHIVAFASWTELTDARFDSCDDVSANDRYRICAMAGPVLETTGLCLYVLGAIFFVTLWETKLPRKDGKEQDYDQVGVNDF
ncbi:MAG: hypothetical protein V2I33_24260 [Kangiellaceae bacterium]|nr:hypothetical protein [Kangiellaceae bacterium]